MLFLTLALVTLTLFAVFWLIQTTELWNRGLRRPDPASLTGVPDAPSPPRHP